MYYEAKPSDVYLKYKNVQLYHVYKNDNEDHVRTFWFGVTPWVTDACVDSDNSPFDIRESRTKSIPFGRRKLDPPYEYDPKLPIEINMQRLIDLGGIDNQPLIEEDIALYNATTVKTAIREVLNIYHTNDLCFQELFATLKFPNLKAGEILEIYSTLSEMIDGDEICIHRSSGDTEKL